MAENFRNFAIGFLGALNKRQEEQRQIQQWMAQRIFAARFNDWLRSQGQPKQTVRGPGVKRIGGQLAPKFIRRTPFLTMPKRILKPQFGQFSPNMRRLGPKLVLRKFTKPQVIKLAFKLAQDAMRKDTTNTYAGKPLQKIMQEFIPAATEMLTSQATK